jgi:hypothetical protein
MEKASRPRRTGLHEESGGGPAYMKKAEEERRTWRKRRRRSGVHGERLDSGCGGFVSFGQAQQTWERRTPFPRKD